MQGTTAVDGQEKPGPVASSRRPDRYTRFRMSWHRLAGTRSNEPVSGSEAMRNPAASVARWMSDSASGQRRFQSSFIGCVQKRLTALVEPNWKLKNQLH